MNPKVIAAFAGASIVLVYHQRRINKQKKMFIESLKLMVEMADMIDQQNYDAKFEEIVEHYDS